MLQGALKNRMRLVVVLALAVLLATVWLVSGSPASADHSATITFQAESCTSTQFPASCTEKNMTFTSLFPNGHLHLVANTLFNHSLCCSHPYEITHVGGKKFTLVQATVSGAFGPAATWTSVNGAQNMGGNGIHVFSPAFSCITRALWDETGGSRRMNNLVVKPCDIEVDIDIKPGSDPSSYGCNSKGNIPVAVLGSNTFDVNDIDADSVSFGVLGTETGEVHQKKGAAKRHVEDVNGDGVADMVFHFAFTSTGFGCEFLPEGEHSVTLTGKLTGKLTNGTPIKGASDLRLVGK